MFCINAMYLKMKDKNDVVGRWQRSTLFVLNYRLLSQFNIFIQSHSWKLSTFYCFVLEDRQEHKRREGRYKAAFREKKTKQYHRGR